MQHEQKHKKIVVCIGEDHRLKYGPNSLLTALDKLHIYNQTYKQNTITYSFGMEGVDKALYPNTIETAHDMEIDLSLFLCAMFSLEINRPKGDNSIPETMDRRNKVMASDIEKQQTDVVFVVVGNGHVYPEMYEKYKGTTSVPQLLRNKGYTVFDYDATNGVVNNIAEDVLEHIIGHKEEYNKQTKPRPSSVCALS